jgi:phospholipid/cholesterol/gamma-HCH transport system ATP-binding protein
MTAAQAGIAIEVRGLSVDYGEHQVLDRIDFEVRKGEIMVIMGESGSGKSTLLKTILGLYPPTCGTVRVLDCDVGRASQRELFKLRRNFGVAFQGGALFSSMNLLDNVCLPLRQHTALDEDTIRIMARLKLELMNLSGFDYFMPAQLSGGMRKRAGLARAVVMDPKLLFFDEPSAGLDPVTSAELDQLILKLREALDMTVVVVTHELQSAFKIADRVAVLGEGRLRAVGTVDEIRNADDEYIQNMLHRRPRDEQIDPDAYLGRLTGVIAPSRSRRGYRPAT